MSTGDSARTGDGDLRAGRLLVATPALAGSSFGRAVVLLLQHAQDGGALGVILNRPSEAELGSVLPGWDALAASPAVVFEGGPVQPGAAICLGRGRAGADSSPAYAVLQDGPLLTLGTVDLDSLPQDVERVVDRVRVFAGYAGWSPGQLEDEVAEGSWWVLDALPGDAFAADPQALWQLVLRRQGFPLSLAASYPPDPTLN